MKRIEDAVRERTLIFDGAMGTSLIGYNLSIDDYEGHENCHDLLSVTRPDVVKKIHAAYFEAGCDIVETNSFGANPLTFSEWGISDRAYEVAKSSAEIAREVADEFSTSDWPRFVSGSVGPGSKLPTLLQVDFDTLYESYLVQMKGLVDGGVDVIQIETSQDILQVKSALTAAFDAMKECGKKVPVIVQVTIERNGRMLLGTPIEAVIAALTPFDILALGINCGTGPDSMHGTIKTLAEKSPFLISVLPNAGLPELIDGKLVYNLGPDEFSDHVASFVKDHGAHFVGGCCGTTPSYIKAVCEKVKGLKGFRNPVEKDPSSGASNFRDQSYAIEPRPLIIGERTNANGSKIFKEALLAEDTDAMFDVALDQQGEGAHLLDLTVAYAGRDEKADLVKMVQIINRDLELPLCIDSTEPESIEAALKCYGGRALINSINFEDGGKKATEVIRIAKRYGAAVIGLTIDENGLATTAKRKVEVARKIIELAEKEGLSKKDVMIDTLTFTLGSGDPDYFNAGVETFEAISQIKKEYPEVLTVLGVSNCSFGLKAKARKILNAVFLYHAVAAGLDAAIFHAGKVLPMHLIKDEERKFAEDLVFNRRTEDYDPLHSLIQWYEKTKNTKEETSSQEKLSPPEALRTRVIEGRVKELKESVEKVLETMPALEIINTVLLDAMKEIGVKFGEGSIQLPFVLKSAEVVKKSCDILEPHIQSSDSQSKAVVLLATVKGDIHDIGKNLIDIILSNNGYKVINIGTDRSALEIVAAAKEHNPDYIGLSALLVRSSIEMKNVASELKEAGVEVPILCGGAALTQEYIQKEVSPLSLKGAFYAGDAFEAMKIMEEK